MTQDGSFLGKCRQQSRNIRDLHIIYYYLFVYCSLVWITSIHFSITIFWSWEAVGSYDEAVILKLSSAPSLRHLLEILEIAISLRESWTSRFLGAPATSGEDAHRSSPWLSQASNYSYKTVRHHGLPVALYYIQVYFDTFLHPGIHSPPKSSFAGLESMRKKGEGRPSRCSGRSRCPGAPGRRAGSRRPPSCEMGGGVKLFKKGGVKLCCL